MMNKTPLGHMQFNVNADNLEFYRDLMGFLNWETLHDGDGMLGVASDYGLSVWFAGGAKVVSNDYDGLGLNHFAFAATSIADVNESASYLKDHNVDALFETPRHRTVFAEGDDQTYYQVMFESPDRILFEVVYTGPK